MIIDSKVEDLLYESIATHNTSAKEILLYVYLTWQPWSIMTTKVSLKIKTQRIIHWLTMGKFLLGIILLIIISIVMPFYSSENLIKYYGLFVLITGILTAILGIAFKLKPFTISILSLFIQYFKDFPLIKKSSDPILWQPPELTAEVGDIKVKPTNPKTIEEIIIYVNKEFEDLKTEVINKESKILERIKDIENNASEIKTELGRIREQSKNTISGVDMELFGVVCLVIGTIYSTIPCEIQKIFQ